MRDKDRFVEITWEAWDEKYQPVLEEDDYLRFETFGEDLEVVKNTDALKVWSVTECGDDMYIQSGNHPVNLMYYLITKVPREESESFNFIYYEEERKVCILELLEKGKEFPQEYMKDKYGRWLYFEDYEAAEEYLTLKGVKEEELDKKYTLERVDIDKEMNKLLKVTVSVIVRDEVEAEKLSHDLANYQIAQEGLYTIECGGISALTHQEAREVRDHVPENVWEK